MMRKLILKTLVYLALVVLGDFVFGKAIGYMVNHIDVGGQGRDNYICREMKDEVLVFGSSRAVHHYETQVMADSLGMSAYNCGADGCGILLAYARLSMATERYQPKIIIYDVVAGYDLLKSDNMSQLKWIRNWYDRKGIPELFQDVEPSEKYKMMSQTYRYNSSFVKSAFVFLTGEAMEVNVNGFVPLEGVMKPKKKRVLKGKNEVEEDSVKMKYMEKFVQLAKGSKLIFVKSPIWYEEDSLKMEEMRGFKEWCERKGIPFHDFTNHPKYMHHEEYFNDGKHMNAVGAREFTKDLMTIIKEDLE